MAQLFCSCVIRNFPFALFLQKQEYSFSITKTFLFSMVYFSVA
jgi:hypothetical protein